MNVTLHIPAKAIQWTGRNGADLEDAFGLSFLAVSFFTGAAIVAAPELSTSTELEVDDWVVSIGDDLAIISDEEFQKIATPCEGTVDTHVVAKELEEEFPEISEIIRKFQEQDQPDQPDQPDQKQEKVPADMHDDVEDALRELGAKLSEFGDVEIYKLSIK